MKTNPFFDANRAPFPVRGLRAAVASVLLLCCLFCARIPAQPVSPGSALILNGTNQYAYVNAPLIASNASFTVELWARRGRTNAQEYLAALGGEISKPASNHVFRLGFRTNNSFFVSFLSNDLATATAYTDTNWHHWAVSFNSTNGLRRLFADGALVANDTSAPFGASQTVKFLFGWDSVGTFYRGALDELRVWNSARDDSQIAANRNRPLTGAEPGLIAYYRCDAINAGQVPDATTNNRALNLAGVGTLGASGTIFLLVTTDPASGADARTATLNSTINPYGSVTTGWFEWGTASGIYPNSTPAQAVGNGTNAVATSALLTNLAPGTTYYFRAAASNAVGTVVGSELSFRTWLLVTNSADFGPGTLRQANAVALDGDVITFDTASPITLTSGEIVISNDISLLGPGAQQLAINGSAKSRIFDITNAIVNISGLSITNGRASEGGGIRNAGTLTLDQCVISDCSTNGLAPGRAGGGIENTGVLIARNCLLARNQARFGGGFSQYLTGTAVFINCSFVGNIATAVGGSAVDAYCEAPSCSVVLEQCTFSGNTAIGGANCTIYNGGAVPMTMRVDGCTIASNICPGTGTAVLNDAGGILSMQNTILAGNTTSNFWNIGSFTALGGNVSSDDTVGELRNANARLMPLGDYGGFTPTHPLWANSPAIGFANPTNLLASDQRGWPRLAGGAPDSGAVEFHPTYNGQFGSNNTWNVYVFVDNGQTWVNANAAAQAALFHGHAGHLASVHSSGENQFIRNTVAGAQYAWLGLTDNEHFGGAEAGTNRVAGWAWTSGEPFTFQNWAATDPNDYGAGEDAGILTPSGQWWDSGIGAFGQDPVNARYVIEFETRAASPVVEITPGPLLPVNLRPELAGRANLFRVVEARGNTNVSDIRTAAQLLALGDGALTYGFAPSINHHDPDNAGTDGTIPGKQPFLSDTPGVDDEWIQALYKGRIRIPAGQGGDWTFGIHCNDGFALRIVGQAWNSVSGNGFIDPADPSVITFPTPTSDANTRGIVTLAPGEYDVEFVACETTGGAFWELYAAHGAFTNDADTTEWRLVGAPGGLELAGPFGTGGALEFGGVDGEVNVPHNTALNAYPLTLSAWFQTTQSDSTQRGIVTKYAVGSVNGYQVFLKDGRLHAWYFSPGGWVWDGADGLDGGFVADGKWHHAAFVVDQSGGKLYTDGVLKTNVAWTGAAGVATTTEPLGFARYGSAHFPGKLDEAQLWNRALSDEEIHAAMFRPPDTNDTTLVAAWRFQELSGNTVFDATTHGFAGTFGAGVARAPSSIAELYPIANTADSGAGSLREAVGLAPGATLRLTGADPIALTSDPLNITNSVRIEGGEVRRTITRDAGAAEFPLLTASECHLQIENLTLTGGSAVPPFYSGGAILCLNGALSARNCAISNNSAVQGGGINAHSSDLFLREVEFSKNQTASPAPSGIAALGGGLLVIGNLHLWDCTVSENTSSYGGGLFWRASFGTAYQCVIEGSTFLNNSAAAIGGGIDASFFSASGGLLITNSTFSANAASNGAALFADGPGALVNCSLSGNIVSNTPLSALHFQPRVTGSLAIGNCLVANTQDGLGNPAPDVFGTINSLGHNLIENTNGAVFTNVLAGNIHGLDPLLGPIANNGGRTLTHALLPGSPARDAGDNALALAPTDQRGQPRNRGGMVDIGSYESCLDAITVSNTADSGPGSLRQAVGDLCDCGTIEFATNLNGKTITLTGGEIPVLSDATIRGPGANLLTLSGNYSSRILNAPSANLTISDLTFEAGRTPTNGSTANQSGGAIFTGGSLEVARCFFLGNRAQFSGGAIVVVPGVSPTVSLITDSTFEQNSVGHDGNGNGFMQGLFGGPVEKLSRATITQCTFSGNLGEPGTGLWGGAIANSRGLTAIEQCTITGNTADYGGGVFNYLGTVTVRNSIIAGNSASSRGPDLDQQDASGTVSLGHNLIGDAAGMSSNAFIHGVSGDLVGTAANPLNPMLGPLADNGGFTRTHALLPGSPARDAGDSASGLTLYDQRGFPRIRGAAMDIGAYEAATLQLSAREIGGQIQLLFSGEPSLNYTILTATNLALPPNQWTPLGAAAELTRGEFQFLDAATNSPGRFYRARWP